MDVELPNQIAALLLGCVIAAVAAWRWGVRGGFLGFVAFSGLIVLRTEAQYWFDPKRDAGVLDAAVVSMGIAFAAVWTLCIFLVGIVSRRRRVRRIREDTTIA